MNIAVLILVGIWLSPGLMGDAGDACGPDRDFHMHEDPDGNSAICCKTINCSKGFQGRPCQTVRGKASCVECPKGTFKNFTSSSAFSKFCTPKQLCNTRDGYVVTFEGSSVQDRVCECDNHSGYYKLKDGKCKRKYCPSGEGLKPDGSCSPCRLGTYKPTNTTFRCIQKTDCKSKGMAYSYIDLFSTTKDYTCVNTTGLGNVTPFVNFVTSDDDYDSKTENVTVINDYKSSTSHLAIVGVVVAILFLIILLISLFCLRRYCNPKPVCGAVREKVTYSKEVVKFAQQHDENTSLSTVHNVPVVSYHPNGRGPSEVDETQELLAEKTFLQRQTTVDSGYCNGGNSSESERGSFELKLESEPNTPISLGAGAPTLNRQLSHVCADIPCPQSMNTSPHPANLSPSQHSQADSLGLTGSSGSASPIEHVTCGNCGKFKRSPSYNIHIHGAYSQVNVCCGEGQNGAEHNHNSNATTPLEEDHEIERTSNDSGSSSEEALNQTSDRTRESCIV